MSNKVVILHNKISDTPTIDELDVLDQAKIARNSLLELGYQVEILSFSFKIDEVIANLRRIKPVFVFNLVEGIDNDGQLIHIAPSILDYLKIPYTGCNKEATFLTTNKVITKQLMKYSGIKTSEWVTSDDASDNEFVEGQRYIIKAIWEDASIGLEEDSVVLVNSKEELIKRIKQKNEELGIEFFAERYLHGRDFSATMIAGQVLPIREIEFVDYEEQRAKVLGYKSKWEEDSEEYIKTQVVFDFPETDKKLLEDLAEISKKCWDVFKLSGYARIDFRTDEAGIPYVLEVNPNPCISDDTAFYNSLKRAGLSYNDGIKQIINDIHCIKR